MTREAHGLASEVLRHAGELEHHAARLDDGNPALRVALAGAHAGLGRLLGEGLVREDVDPHLAATLGLAGHRDTSGLDLAVGEPTGLERLQAVLAELDALLAPGEAMTPTAMHLAELDALGRKHYRLIPPLRSGRPPPRPPWPPPPRPPPPPPPRPPPPPPQPPPPPRPPPPPPPPPTTTPPPPDPPPPSPPPPTPPGPPPPAAPPAPAAPPPAPPPAPPRAPAPAPGPPPPAPPPATPAPATAATAAATIAAPAAVT